MDPKDIKKILLIIKSRLFNSTLMPFGLKNTTSVFSQTMGKVFKKYMDKFLKVFFNDFNVHNQYWAKHLKHIKCVLQKSREVNLKHNLNKCSFAKKSISFLGHVINKEGIQPNPRKIKIMIEFHVPTIATNVRALLGLLQTYVKGYVHILLFFCLSFKKILEFLSRVLIIKKP